MSVPKSRFDVLFRTFDAEVRTPIARLAKRPHQPLVYVYRRGRIIAYENYADVGTQVRMKGYVEVNPAAKMMNEREIWFQDHPTNHLEAHVEYAPDYRDKILIDPDLPFFAIPVDAAPGIDGFN